MKKRLTVLVDMDQVLENFTEEWITALNERFGTEVDFNSLTEWNIYTAFPGHSEKEIDEISFEDEFIRRLRPINGAVEYSKKLTDDGHLLYVVTSTDYRTVWGKFVHIILKYFPFIPWKNVIITANKKIIKGDVLVDDGIHNLEGGEYRKILFSAPYNMWYNAEENGMLRADNWREVYELISKMAEEE